VSDAPRAPAAPWPAVQEGHVEGTKHGSGEGLLADRGVTRRSTRSSPTRFPTRWGTIEAARGARPPGVPPSSARGGRGGDTGRPRRSSPGRVWSGS